VGQPTLELDERRTFLSVGAVAFGERPKRSLERLLTVTRPCLKGCVGKGVHLFAELFHVSIRKPFSRLGEQTPAGRNRQRDARLTLRPFPSP
jgi:hypothetical protein